MPAFLVPVDSGQCLIPLEKAIVLIGRQADCDVSLTNSRKISRKHCCIAQVNNKFVIRDLGSTNGVFLNGRRIQKESTIAVGDDLVIGDVHFKMTDEIPSSAQPDIKSGNKQAANPQLPPIPPIPVPGSGRIPALPPIPMAKAAPDDDFAFDAELDDEDDDDDDDEIQDIRKNGSELKRLRRSTPSH